MEKEDERRKMKLKAIKGFSFEHKVGFQILILVQNCRMHVKDVSYNICFNSGLEITNIQEEILANVHESTHLLQGQLVMFPEGPWLAFEPYPRLWVYT